MVNKEQSLKDLAEVLRRSVYCPDCEWWYDITIPNVCTHLADLETYVPPKKYAGEYCTCGAYAQFECGCGADWTDPEIYELRQKVVNLQFKNEELRQDLVIEQLNPNRRAEIVRLVEVIDDLIEMLLKRSLTFPEQHFIDEYRANGEI